MGFDWKQCSRYRIPLPSTEKVLGVEVGLIPVTSKRMEGVGI